MKFHFEFDIKKPPVPVQHPQRLLLVGSCFTENIGEKLRLHKFETLENPNGILFNPVSVAEAIGNYIDNKKISSSELFEWNEAWHSWKHHSRYSATTKEEAVQRINESTHAAHLFLEKADQLLITLGSAWTYTLTADAANAATGSVAANNHKAPAGWFQRKLLNAENVTGLLQALIDKLLQFNPHLQIIFTISPVRHLREGVIDNNRSKAVLIQAVHRLAERNPALYYFPAYELVIDDLRDYRFYAEDLVHPNYQATQYVWEKFVDACMPETTKELMKQIAEINLAYHHKPFNATSQQHRKFLASFHTKAKSLQEKYGYLDFSKELDFFSRAD